MIANFAAPADSFHSKANSRARKFYNVVVMKVEDVGRFLGWREKIWDESKGFADVVAHVRPIRDGWDTFKR